MVANSSFPHLMRGMEIIIEMGIKCLTVTSKHKKNSWTKMFKMMTEMFGSQKVGIYVLAQLNLDNLLWLAHWKEKMSELVDCEVSTIGIRTCIKIGNVFSWIGTIRVNSPCSKRGENAMSILASCTKIFCPKILAKNDRHKKTTNYQIWGHKEGGVSA